MVGNLEAGAEQVHDQAAVCLQGGAGATEARTVRRRWTVSGMHRARRAQHKRVPFPMPALPAGCPALLLPCCPEPATHPTWSPSGARP